MLCFDQVANASNGGCACKLNTDRCVLLMMFGLSKDDAIDWVFENRIPV